MISKQFTFNGKWLPSLDPAKIGAENYSEMQNMRPVDDGVEGVQGFSKINTTALTTYVKIRNGHQLKTDRTLPSIVLVQAYDASGNSQIFQNQTAIPSQGDFEATALHTDASGGGAGVFSDAPVGVAYTNGVESMAWWGPEGRVAGFFVVSDISVTDNDIALNNAAPDTIVKTAGSFLDKGFKAGQTITITGAATAGNNVDQIIQSISANGLTLTLENPGNFVGTDAAGASTVTVACNGSTEYVNPVDYTDAVNNELTTSGNLAILGGGDDDYAVLLLHMNGTDGSTSFIDDSASAHSMSVAGDCQLDTAVQKFGTASALFDGTTDSIYAADHADWAYGTGGLTIEGWINFTSTSGIQILYSQNDSGSYDSAIIYFCNDAIYILVSDGGSKIISETGTWAPSTGTWYHWALIRGWGGVANDWAFTVNGTAVHTFTNAGTWPDHNDSLYIGGASTGTLIDLSPNRLLVNPEAAASTALIQTTTTKYGDGAVYLDGAADYIVTSGNFHLVGDNTDSKTIELWVKHDAHSGTENYISNYQDVNNYWTLEHIHGTGIQLRVRTGGAPQISFSGGEITDTDWHHVALVKVADEFGIYIDGTQTAYVQDSYEQSYSGAIYNGVLGAATQYLQGYVSDIRLYAGNPYSAAPNATPDDTITIPTASLVPDANTSLLISCNTKSFDGHLDEVRISDKARWTSTFSVPVRAYQETQRRFYLFATRPLQGFKAYISAANTEAATTLSGWEWTGKSFSALSLTDGTSSGGITMAQTGSVTFSSTVSTAKPWHFEGLYLYAYMFEMSDGGAEIYHVSADADFQKIVDVWDGVYRQPIAFQVYDDSDANYDDWTLQVIQESSNLYPIGAEIEGMTTSDHFVAGFDDRMAAIKFEMIGDRANTATCYPTIYYWGGTNWVTVGTVFDSTTHERAIKALSQSGMMAWYPPAEADEAKQTLFGKTGFFYKIVFSATLAGSGAAAPKLVIDLVTGIPAQYTVPPFDVCALYKQQLFLFSYSQGKEGNRADYCLSSAPDVWNGDLTSMNGLQSLYFSNSDKINAAKQIYNRYGSNVITGLLVLKKTETLMLTGDKPEDYKIFPVSQNIGCAAPSTLVSAETGYEIAENVSRNILMWLSDFGPVLFDGAILSPITGIEKFFDPVNSAYVKTSLIARARAWYDTRWSEYNLIIPSGAAATDNNKWLVYNLAKKKWFEKVPTVYPQCGFQVVDTDGIRYVYGGIDTGYMMRLENGNTWNGDGIVQLIETGDFFPFESIWKESRLRRVAAFAKRISEAVSMSIYHYANTETADSTVDGTLALNSGSNRIVWGASPLSGESYMMHRVRFKATTSTTAKGLQLVGWGYEAEEGHPLR